MRSLLTVILAILILGLAGCSKKEQQTTPGGMSMGEPKPMPKEAPVSGISEGERLIYYTCPMESHQHIHSSQPGNCPECGMKLVAGVVTTAENGQYFGCPMEMHSHVRSDKPGTCDLCGMELKPMRLVQ